MIEQPVEKEIRPEFRKIVLVGLGGAGQLILTNVKRLLIDTYGIVPPSVRFLSLDTDAARIELASRETSDQIALAPDEYLHLRVPDPIGFLASNREVSDWFIGPTPVGAITAGAGAVRQNGRLAFFYNFRAIRSRLEKVVTSLNDVNLAETMEHAKSLLDAKCNFTLSVHDPEMYVCGSLAGGTGSGTFVDTGILLRHMMQKTVIHGFFLLDWPYRSKAFAHRIQGNVYAALSELDYFQSLMFGDRAHSSHTLTYGGQEVKVQQAPFDLVHLIDGRNQAGENIDSVDDLCETVANGIFLSVSSMAYRIKSVTDNLLTLVNYQSPTTWDGRYARYSSLGVASIYYPAPELHELISREQALEFCDMALQEVAAGTLGVASGAAKRDVPEFLRLNQLSLEGLLSAVIGNYTIPRFEPSNIGDLKALETAEKKSELAAEQLVQSLYDANGPAHLQGLEVLFRDKIAAIRNDPTCGSSYLRDWLSAISDALTLLQSELVNEISAAEDKEKDLRKVCISIFKEDVEKSSYVLGMGSRKDAVNRWAAAHRNQLAAMARSKALRLVKMVVDALLQLVKAESAGPVTGPKLVASALTEARRMLLSRVQESQKKLDSLKKKRNIVLEGMGQVVVYKAGTVTTCSYSDFKKQHEILKLEDYLLQPWALAGLFESHCRERLVHLLDMTVEGALRRNADEPGNGPDYIRRKIDHLFRKASTLWRFREANVRGLRDKHYDQITNVGVYEQEEGAAFLEDAVFAARANRGIIADHAFSTTRDKYHIWLLNYAAVLPAFLLEDQDQRRAVYDNEISPTYHSFKELELDVPDLFPVDDAYNISLRVLGLAITPGIDVVKDKKLLKGQGHEFTFDIEAVRSKNADRPRVWGLFRKMLDEVALSYDKDDKYCLLNMLTQELKAQVGRILSEPDGDKRLRGLVEAHRDKFKKKLAIRDFSRLISARLTYREVKALEDFVNPERHNLDIEKYIQGN